MIRRLCIVSELGARTAARSWTFDIGGAIWVAALAIGLLAIYGREG